MLATSAALCYHGQCEVSNSCQT